MSRSCKAILWDVGGTLVDFNCSITTSIRRRLSDCQINHAKLSDEFIAQTFEVFFRDERKWRTLDEEESARRVWASRLLEPLGVSESTTEKAALQLGNYFDLYKPVDGIVELLIELREKGLRQAVVSNWPPSLRLFLDYQGLTLHFDPIIYSAEDGIHKPDTRIFWRALNALDIAPKDAVFIGDNPEWDILPTRNMGMRAIHFDPRKTRPEREAEDVPALRRVLMAML